MISNAKTKAARADHALAQLRAVAERLADQSCCKDNARVISGVDLTSLIQGVAAEIDESVLPRVITVSEADQPLVNLTVSNRRLVGVASPDGEDLLASDDAKVDVAGKLINHLREQARFVAPFSITITGRAGDFFAAGSSCSATDLVKSASHIGNGNGLVDFYDDLRPLADASTLLNEGQLVDQYEGNEQSVHLLRALQIEVGKAIETDASPHRGFVKPTCTILPLPGGKQALLGFDKKTTILAILDNSKLDSAITAWRSQFPL